MAFWKKAKTWFREDDSIKPCSNSPISKRKLEKKSEQFEISHSFEKLRDLEKSEVFGSCTDVSEFGKYMAQEYLGSHEDVKLETKMPLLVPLSMRQKASMFQSCGSLDDLLTPMPMARTETFRRRRVSQSMMPQALSIQKLVGNKVLEACVSVTLISKQGLNCHKEWNRYHMVLTKDQLILFNWSKNFYQYQHQREWPLLTAHIIVCSNYDATDTENEGKICLLLTILYDQYLIMFDSKDLALQWLVAIQRKIYQLGLRTLANCQQDHYHLIGECDELPATEITI